VDQAAECSAAAPALASTVMAGGVPPPGRASRRIRFQTLVVWLVRVPVL